MNLNVAVVTGNLTADPELREFGDDGQLCKLRVAVNERVKEGGEWVERPNFFTVTVFGAQAKSCAEYLSKGRAVAVKGRLRWQEYEGSDGDRRQSVELVASQVQFLSSAGGERNGGQEPGESGARRTPAPAAETDDDDDLPF